MTTVKNVGLSPINRGDVKKYTAMQSPSFREDFWDKMNSTNDADYYMYVLNEADKKGLKLEDIDFNGLDSLDDQWAAFYMEAAADNITKKDYGEIDGEAWGELTEKEYLGKILNKKKEYNAWVRQEAEIAAQKEAMSGWDKFWNGVGSFFVELGYGLETIPLALADFVTNWDSGESVGFIEDWRLNLEERQTNLADYERKYTYLRNVDDWDTTFLGDLTIGAAQTLSLMIPAAVSNYLLPGSGMYVMYGASFLENVYEARHNPDVSATQVEIILRAALMTGAEMAIEKLMGASLLDNVVLNGRKFSTELGKVSAKQGLKILGKDIVHEATEEALQELSSGLTNMVLSLGNSSFEQYNSKNLAADIGMAALMGAIFAAGNVINGQIIKDIATGRFIRTLTGKYKAGDVISNKNLISEPKKKTDQEDEKKNSIKDVTKKQKDPNGFHATNFFERIALSANMRTFQENLELAKKGKLSKDEQQLLYNQTMALGQIFGMASKDQLKTSIELLEKLQEYAKVEGAKQEIIDKTDNLYIQSLVTNLSAIQSEAAKTFYGKKISEKEAAKLAKEARISKTKKVIDKKNVEEEVKKVEAKEKDTKKVARKKAIKTLVEEGKTIVTTDGNDIEVLEDNILIPDKYLEDGDPAHAVRSALEKDIAQEFVTFMKNPKRLVGWSKAKAALIKAYPEMKDFTDQQIARNLLFNPNGAYALISILPNSEFNILFLNLLEGIKQVVYKTKVAQAVKNECIKILENNFRFAARTFCSQNLGVNPHDLHNVLTKQDQIYIKNERAKIEAKVSEVARANSKIYSKQMFHDIGDSYNQDTPLNQMNINHEMVYGVESLSYDEYLDLFRKGNPETKKALEEAIKNEPSKFSGWDDSEGVIIPVKFNRDVLLYRGLATINDTEGKYQTVLNQMINARPGDVIDIGKNVSLSADAGTSQIFEGDIMLRLIFPKGQKANTYYTGSFVNSKNAKQAMKKLLENPGSDYVLDNLSGEEYPEFEFLVDNNTKGVVLDHSRYNVLGSSQEKPFQISHVITLDLRPDSAEKVKNHTPIKLDIKEAYKEASEKGSNLLLYSGTLERKIGGINTFTDRAAFETLYGSLLRIKEFKEDIGRWTLGEDLNKQRKEKAEKLEKFRQEGFQVDEDKDHKIFYITPPKPLWVTSEIAEANAYGPGTNVEGDRTVQWGIEVLKDAPTEGVTFYEGNSSLTFDQVPIAIVDIKTDDKGNIFVRGRVGGEDYYTNRNSNKNLTQEEKLRKIFGGYETKQNSPNEDLLKLPEGERLKRIFNNSENQISRQEFHKMDLMQEDAGFTTPEYENETYLRFQKGMLNKKLTPIEKASTTLKDMVTDPETYLSEDVINDIKEEFGDLSKASVYMYLRSIIIEVTDGKKSLTVSENGDNYYFADVTPVKNLNTTKITSEVEQDPEGRSLFDKYEGKTVKATEFWKGEALIGKAADVEIEFTKTGGTYYSDEQNKIYFNIKSKMFRTNSDLLFGINHEFQHVLQSTNRTNRGFALGLDIPKELVEEVKKLYPDSFKNIKTPEEEKKRANEIIYQYSGEEEAFQHATDIDFYPFVVAIKGANYVIFTPNGNKPYQVPFARTNKLDEEKVNTEAIPKAPRVPSKKLRDETNLKFFKKKNKKLRMHPDLQYFVIKADLNRLDEWIVDRISGSKKGTLTKRKLMKWFKETQDMNEYTFKLLKEAFWEDSPILTFQQLCEIGLSLTQEFDENGNLKQIYFRNSDGKEFVIPEGKYRVAIMQHWNSDEDISNLRKIVGFTETQRNQEINFSTLERKAQTSTDDDTIELNLGSEDEAFEAILQDSYTQKAERLYATYRQGLGAKVIRGDLSKEEARTKIKKFGLNYWENLPKEKLDELYLKLMLKKYDIKRNAETITRAVNRNRTHARTRLKNLGTRIWNAVAPKNRNRLPKEVLELYDKNGKIRQDVYKGKGIDEVVRIENLLAETWKRAKRGDYNSKEVEKAYADLEKAKTKLEKMKSKTQTKIKNQNKTATEYVTQIKTKAKVISVESTKKKVPSSLEKLFATNFTKKRISNMQELENFEYFVSEGELFRRDNQEILDSITEAEWIEIIEWFEQSEFVGTEKDLGVFKAIRMFVLADLISKIKNHQIVLNQTWVNRANNIMSSKVHSSAVEMATFGKILNTINPFRKVSEEFNVSEELLDKVNEAWDSDNEEELAKAIDELKEEIAANYVEKNMMEKILAFRYTSMLSGPVTWLRNLLSNYVVKYFNKWSAGIGEFLTKHTFLGKKVRNHEGYILVGTKVTSEVANFIKEELLDNGLLAQLTDGYSKYDPYEAETTKDIDKDYIVRTLVNNWNKKFEQDHAYGDGPMGKMFSKFSSFVRKMISDDKFVNEATLRYFGKMLTEDLEAGRLSHEELKQGIFNSKKIISIFAEAQWLAMNDYMKNANFMTKAMSALNENPWARYIMPLIIPFAQSSWNWWVETIRYSPLSWVSIIPRLIKFDKYVNRMEAKRKSSKKGQSASVQGSMLDRFMVTRDLGKGVIGTSLWTLGIIMAATGVVGLAKDEEDKYVIKIGNAEIDVSNFFGSSSFLAGAALVGAIKDGRWAEMFSVTIDQMARTLFITDMLSTFRFQTVGDYVMELPMNILYSFIPNFIKMLSNNLQVYKVKYDAGILGDLERIATGLIPGLSYAFDVERDPFTGKKRFHKIPIITQALGISYNDVSEVERAAIAVGVGAGQLKGEITVDGEKVKIDSDKANQYRGEIANYYLTQLLEDTYIHNDKRYSQMNREERKDAIKSIMSKSSDYAKIKVWTESGNKYYASSELYYTLKSLGIQNVYQGKGGYIKK